MGERVIPIRHQAKLPLEKLIVRDAPPSVPPSAPPAPQNGSESKSTTANSASIPNGSNESANKLIAPLRKALDAPKKPSNARSVG